MLDDMFDIGFGVVFNRRTDVPPPSGLIRSRVAVLQTASTGWISEIQIENALLIADSIWSARGVVHYFREGRLCQDSLARRRGSKKRAYVAPFQHNAR